MNDHLEIVVSGLSQMFRSTSKGKQGLFKDLNHIQCWLSHIFLADEKLNTLVLNSVLAGPNKSRELFSVCPSNSLIQFQKKQGSATREMDEECDIKIPEIKQNK